MFYLCFLNHSSFAPTCSVNNVIISDDNGTDDVTQNWVNVTLILTLFKQFFSYVLTV